MIDTAMVVQAPQVTAFLVNGVQPERLGNRSPTLQPTANVFATQDGFIQVVALKEPQVEALFETLDVLAEYTVATFHTAAARVANTAAVNALLGDAFVRQPTAHWLPLLIAAGVPVAEIRDFAAVTADPQFEGRAALVEINSTKRSGERVRVVGSGYTASTDAPAVTRQPPRLGQHTDEILTELGYSVADIASMREQGVI
ncbi:MAG: CoA transferase [Gammaproteobacteria bacterium]|nr:CoA transferase [Gammaproteobacteria bacterium]